MKKLILTLFALFVYSSSYADTETINWYIDGNVYNTTQCESGGDVSLPPTPPERLGYTFTGWQEVFNRGTFASWAAIPNVATGYLSDSYGSYTPKENDYIIVSDASDVPAYENKIVIQTDVNPSQAYALQNCSMYIDNTDYGCIGTSGASSTVFNGNITMSKDIYVGAHRFYWQSKIKQVVFNGNLYNPNTYFFTVWRSAAKGYGFFINGYPYTGTWRLRYVGNWDDYKRGGWIPEKKLD